MEQTQEEVGVVADRAISHETSAYLGLLFDHADEAQAREDERIANAVDAQFESPEGLARAVFRGNEDMAFETIIAEIVYHLNAGHPIATEKAVHNLDLAVKQQARLVAGA